MCKWDRALSGVWEGKTAGLPRDLIRRLWRSGAVSKVRRILGERRQVRSFDAFVRKYMNGNGERLGCIEPLTQRALLEKAKARRRILGRDGKPGIVAFGGNDWEKDGLWPAFSSIGHFSLSRYGVENIEGAMPKRINGVFRKKLADSFLKFVDDAAKRHPVTCAFFYAWAKFISEDLFRELHARGIWTVLMGLDDKNQFFGTGRGPNGEADQLYMAIKCDIYWTTWRAGALVVAARGGTPWYAPEAANPEIYRPINLKRDIDVVFVGQRYGQRELLIEYFRRQGIDVRAYGRGWKKAEQIETDEVVELYNRAQVVLGCGSVGHTERFKHLKARDYEVPMCGSLYLTSYNPELADHFAIGQELLCYSSPQEAVELCYWILRNPSVADEIRGRALARSLRDHTWVHRIRQMLDLFPGTMEK